MATITIKNEEIMKELSLNFPKIMNKKHSIFELEGNHLNEVVVFLKKNMQMI